MSAEQITPSDLHEEVSGWWPSERSAKSRLKAFFSRARSETFTKQQSPDDVDLQHAQRAFNVLPNGTQVPTVGKDHTTWPTRTLRTSQRKLVRAQKSLPNLFRVSSQSPPVEEMPSPYLVSPVLQPVFSRRNASRNASRSTTDSSVHTLNSLDHLRERSGSENHSISTAHTSFSSHASTPMHSPDTSFSSTASYESQPLKSPHSPACLPSQHGIANMTMPKKASRPSPIRTTSLDTFTGRTADNDAVYMQKPLPSAPQLYPLLDDKGRRISIVAPLPDSGHIRKTSARYRCDSRGIISEPLTPTSPVPRPLSSRSNSSSHERTTSYSLFPRTPSFGQSRLPAGSTPPSPATATALPRERAVDDSRSPPPLTTFTMTLARETAAAPIRSTPSPPTLATTQSSSLAKSKRHALVPLATNTTLPNPLPSPSSISSAGSEVKPPPPLRLAKAPSRQQLNRQKSLPSLHSKCPPSGPPPTVPLPALPKAAVPVRTF